jgi:hypothetical protein
MFRMTADEAHVGLIVALKAEFPMLQIKVYDAAEKMTLVESPSDQVAVPIKE